MGAAGLGGAGDAGPELAVASGGNASDVFDWSTWSASSADPADAGALALFSPRPRWARSVWPAETGSLAGRRAHGWCQRSATALGELHMKPLQTTLAKLSPILSLLASEFSDNTVKFLQLSHGDLCDEAARRLC